MDAKNNVNCKQTDVESALLSLKSELGLRTIYYQKENRVDTNIFISILAYHILKTIRYQLKQININHYCKVSW